MSEIKPQDIEALLESFEASSWSEMRVKVEGLELFVSKTPGARPAMLSETLAGAPAAPAPPPVRSAEGRAPAANGGALRTGPIPDGWVAVRAPNLGTFYRSPKPGAPPYVKVGQRVEPTTELCLIEVMKLFTSVTAGVSGVVRQVLVEDAELVEFDQALFLIEARA